MAINIFKIYINIFKIYIKNFSRSLLPIIAPKKRKTPNTQPDREKEEMPPKKAPILQPEATAAPYPIRSPPTAAKAACLKDLILFILKLEASKAASSAPIIIPRFLRIAGS